MVSTLFINISWCMDKMNKILCKWIEEQIKLGYLESKPSDNFRKYHYGY